MVAEVAPTIQPAVGAILGAVGGSGATALAVFFLKDFFATTKKDLHELSKAVQEQAKATQELVFECRSLTKDLRKMEGVCESQQKQLGDSIKETATVLANIKALWAALQRIHPEAVPKRLSDPGVGGR